MSGTETLAEALCEAQKAMRNPAKDKTARVRTRGGGEYTYSYTTLDAVLDIVRPALNAHGVFLTQHSERIDDAHIVLHTSVVRGGENAELDATPYQYDTDPQEFGKRETYARRYSLLKAFGLAGDDDTDGDTGPSARPAPIPEPRGAADAVLQKSPLDIALEEAAKACGCTVADVQAAVKAAGIRKTSDAIAFCGAAEAARTLNVAAMDEEDMA